MIDKDFASEFLVEQVKADLFIILTGMDNVYVNFNQENQLALEKVSVEELENYIKEQQFAAGSMLPKVEACIAFAKYNKKAKSIITSLENIGDLIESGKGTIISS